ncbi:RagB/SusD family nutrient uptake outer membrane protein [Sediminitomix flava]|uniref:Putative outer membrane starch-binding protein n=1 Tax=Sediminitomix flava TaxID=379075 RepID=A0A315YXW8_SEDFL|nr:RagB/SusD family nutrient uptake outer membrane protein [Sediminitomix flava]PWJ34972.1 putative outer membrane starch-binding protein [Sediminitomix flava]
MKKYIYSFFISATLFSCSSILEREPLDIISEEQVWSDPNLIRANLVELYNQAPTRRLFHFGFPWGSGAPWVDGNAEPAREPGSYVVISDESMASYSWVESRNLNINGYQRNDKFMEYWDYKIIRNCNEFLEKIEEGDLRPEDKDLFKAEARFIRAFVYFEKVKRYGGVPLITVAQDINAPEEELYPERNTEQEVYDFIIQECEEISVILTDASGTEHGRANRFAALSLQSRAALYAGSIAKYGQSDLGGVLGISNSAEAYFQKSLEASNKVINEGGYSLYNKHEDKAFNYQSIFLDDDNPEVIFEREFSGVAKGHSFDYFSVVQGYGSGWGSYLNPTLEIVEAYDFIDGSDGKIDWENENRPLAEVLANKDPRMHATVYFDGNMYPSGDVLDMYIVEENGQLLDVNPGEWKAWDVDGEEVWLQNVGEHIYPKRSDGTKTGFFIKKFVSVDDLRVPQMQSETDWVEFRLAEIYLNQAEAALELGQTSVAIEAVNKVRERAGVANVTSLTMDKLRKERQVELAFETHRIWDLRRWRIAGDVLNQVHHGIVTVRQMPENTYRYIKYCCDAREEGLEASKPRYFNTDRMYYYPLGEEICNNNPNLVENPNY